MKLREVELRIWMEIKYHSIGEFYKWQQLQGEGGEGHQGDGTSLPGDQGKDVCTLDFSWTFETALLDEDKESSGGEKAGIRWNKNSEASQQDH
jgi:hypothetical protein